ncbi:uncharacterized protein [Amphiura filiformis]|uniref:uncharacterized protein n=1 Tax=Amphiura filiformis TaxID=82378 RepID=UPI003B213E41
MIPLAVGKDPNMVRLMAETLGFLCSCEQLHFRLVKAGVLSIILGLSMMHDSDLAFWAAALLLNLAMTSGEVKFAILKAGGLQALVELCLGDHENSQVTTMAAKTLVMLGFTEEPLKIHLHCDSESGNVNIHNKNFYLSHPGITVMVWDTLISDELVCQNFNKENSEVIPSLALDIPSLQEAGQNIGNLVFITIKGKHCAAYLQGLKGVLHFNEDTSFSGITNLDPLTLPDNHMCAIVSQLSAPNRLDVWHLDKSDKPIDLQLQYSYGDIVNNRVYQLLLLPSLKCIDSIPAHSPISRVSELELLEVFACHNMHLQTLRDSKKLLDILTDMIWYCAEKGFESLESEPLAVAHCLGALRVLAVITTHEYYKSELLDKDTASAIVSLLFNLVNIWLASQIGQPVERVSPGRQGDTIPMPGTLTPRPVSRGDALATGGVLTDELDGDMLENTEESLLKSQTLEDTISSLGSMVQQLAHSTSHHGRETVNVTAVDSAVYTELESEARTDDQQIMYTRVAKCSALIINNLASHHNPDTIKTSQIVLNKAGATHMLWAVLLSSTDDFKNVISLPICYTLTRLVTTDFPPVSDDSVVLNPDDKTSSLIISSDCLEVSNVTMTRLVTTYLPPVSDDSVVLNPDDKTSSLIISSDCLEVS